MLKRNRYRLWFLVMALVVGQTIGVGGVIAQETRRSAYSELSLVKLDREIELRDRVFSQSIPSRMRRASDPFSSMCMRQMERC